MNCGEKKSELNWTVHWPTDNKIGWSIKFKWATPQCDWRWSRLCLRLCPAALSDVSMRTQVVYWWVRVDVDCYQLTEAACHDGDFDDIGQSERHEEPVGAASMMARMNGRGGAPPVAPPPVTNSNNYNLPPTTMSMATTSLHRHVRLSSIRFCLSVCLFVCLFVCFQILIVFFRGFSYIWGGSTAILSRFTGHLKKK